MLTRVRDVVLIVAGVLISALCSMILLFGGLAMISLVETQEERDQARIERLCGNPLMRLPECPPR